MIIAAERSLFLLMVFFFFNSLSLTITGILGVYCEEGKTHYFCKTIPVQKKLRAGILRRSQQI